MAFERNWLLFADLFVINIKLYIILDTFEEEYKIKD